MKITSTSRNVLKDGTIKGTIHVQEKVQAPGTRHYAVHYERTPNGHAEQWGAHAEVLCATYPTFERLISDDLH